MFRLPNYIEPDFSQPKYVNAPDAVIRPSSKDKSVPDNFHGDQDEDRFLRFDGEFET